MVISNTMCPLCNAPMIIKKGTQKSASHQRYHTKKSHMYCSKCKKTTKEALALKLRQNNTPNHQEI